MDDSQTPRALIGNLIENNPSEMCLLRSYKDKNIGETPLTASIQTRRSPRNQMASKRGFSEAKNGSEIIKKHKNVMNDSENTVTPRSAIEAFLQGESKIEQTSKRDHKELTVTPGKRFSSLNTSQISSSSRKPDLRKKATVKHLLKSQSFSTGPTPRGMIEGFIADVQETTPAVKDRSDTHNTNSASMSEAIFSQRRNLSTLGESYYLPCSAPESSTHKGRMLRTSPRLRKQINLEEFAQKTAEKMEQMREGNESTRDIRSTTWVAEVVTQPDVSVNQQTEDLESVASVKEHESDVSLTSVTPDTLSLRRSRPSHRSSKGSVVEKSGVNVSEQPWSSSAVSSEKRRLSTRCSITSGTTEVEDSRAIGYNVSTQQSPRLSALGNVTPQHSMSAQTTNTGRSQNSAAFKDQLVTGTIQEIVANVVPASDSVLTPATEHNQEQLENSTGRILRSQSQTAKNERNKSSFSINTPSKSIVSSVRQDRSVSHNEIVEDEDVENEGEPEVEEDHDNADTDGEQVEEEEEVEEYSDIDQDASTDEEPDKENLADGDPEDHDQFESNLGNVSAKNRAVTVPVASQGRSLHQLLDARASGTNTRQTEGATQSKKGPRKRNQNSSPRLPRALTKSIFSHFSQFKFSKDVLNEVELVAETFWKHAADDLAQYAHHANRTTLQYSDVELLMKRQGFVTEKQSLHTLIRRWLPLEYRAELIPVAYSKNMVYPKENMKGPKSTH